MLRVDGVTKQYRGGVVANEGVTLGVASGEVVGLLGHNGAGKTTLVNQIVGIAKPDEGSIVVDGVDAVASPARVRERCAVQAQAHVPLTGLTPAKAIELVGRLRGARADVVVRRRDELIDRLDIGEWRDRPSAHLSGGVKRLVSFCVAAAVPAPLVMLDEPTNDVDPVRRRLLWNEIRRLADDGAAVLLVTHNVAEAERAVDRLVVLDRGKVIARGTAGELTAALRDVLRLEVRWAPDAPRPALPPAVVAVAERVGSATGRVAASDADHILTWAREAQATSQIETFGLQPASLEDAYVHLVSEPTMESPS